MTEMTAQALLIVYTSLAATTGTKVRILEDSTSKLQVFSTTIQAFKIK